MNIRLIVNFEKRSMLVFGNCFVGVFLIISHLQLVAQTPTEILNKYYDTVSFGDFENWNKIRTASIELSSFDNQNSFGGTKNPGQNGLLKIFIYRIWPDSCVIESLVDSLQVSRLYHVGKKQLFVYNNMSPVEMAGDGLYEPYFEFDPVMVKHTVQRSKSVRLMGIEKMDSVQCYNLRVLTKGLVWHFYFNTKTFLLEYWSNSQTDEENPALTKVYNYKRVENVLIPFSELKKRNNSVFYSSEIVQISLNTFIDPKKFEIKE